MRKKFINLMTVLIILSIVMFCILSGFPCMESVRWPGSFWGKIGEPSYDTYTNNFLFMLCLGIIEIFLLFKKTLKSQIVGIGVSTLRAVVTYLSIPLTKYTMEQIYRSIPDSDTVRYTICTNGYIVVSLSIVILGLSITLAFLRIKKQVEETGIYC